MQVPLRCYFLVLIIGGCSYDVKPPSSAQVTTNYSDASRQLALACEKASTGTCHILLDNAGRVQSMVVQVGSTISVPAVEAAARTCVDATPITPEACNWSSVGPSSGA